MMDNQYRTLILYDVSDDRKRYRIVKILESYGQRIQHSVFEAYLTKRQWDKIMKNIKPHVNAETDSFRMYDISLCHREAVYGKETVVENNGCIII